MPSACNCAHTWRVAASWKRSLLSTSRIRLRWCCFSSPLKKSIRAGRTRIISARLMTRRERIIYEEG